MSAPSPSIQELLEIASHIDIRVGLMVNAERHPDADKLYVEQVDFGPELGIRTVISGLVPHFTPEQIQGKLCVFITNLKPASLRGIKSYAMVLVARGPCGTVEFIDPGPNAKPGDRAVFNFSGSSNGFGAPDPCLDPKKLYWETIQERLCINPTTRAITLGEDAILCVGSTVVSTPTLTKGIVS